MLPLCNSCRSVHMGQWLCVNPQNASVPAYSYPKEGSFKKNNDRFDSLLDFYEGEKWKREEKHPRLINLSKNSLAVKG